MLCCKKSFLTHTAIALMGIITSPNLLAMQAPGNDDEWGGHFQMDSSEDAEEGAQPVTLAASAPAEPSWASPHHREEDQETLHRVIAAKSFELAQTNSLTKPTRSPLQFPKKPLPRHNDKQGTIEWVLQIIGNKGNGYNGFSPQTVDNILNRIQHDYGYHRALEQLRKVSDRILPEARRRLLIPYVGKSFLHSGSERFKGKNHGKQFALIGAHAQTLAHLCSLEEPRLTALLQAIDKQNVQFGEFWDDHTGWRNIQTRNDVETEDYLKVALNINKWLELMHETSPDKFSILMEHQWLFERWFALNKKEINFMLLQGLDATTLLKRSQVVKCLLHHHDHSSKPRKIKVILGKDAFHELFDKSPVEVARYLEDVRRQETEMLERLERLESIVKE